MRQRVVLVGFLLSLAALVAVSCGGGGVTIEEYFEELQGIVQEADEQDEALDQEFERLGAAARDAAAVAGLYQRFATIFGDSLRAVQALDVPSEVADPHAEMVASLSEVFAILDALADQIRVAESEAELEVIFERFQLGEAAAGFDRACDRLEGIALADGIEVDLECGDE